MVKCIECANGVTRFVNSDTQARPTSCAYVVDDRAGRVWFYAYASAVDATCETENGLCVKRRARHRLTHAARGASVVSARGECGEHCTLCDAGVYHAGFDFNARMGCVAARDVFCKCGTGHSSRAASATQLVQLHHMHRRHELSRFR